MRFLSVVALGLLLAAPVLGQDPEPEAGPMVIPKPPDMDDETWERLKKGYAGEKEKFIRLLAALDENRVDYTRDGIRDILGKQNRIREIAAHDQQDLLSGMVRPEFLALNWVLLQNETAPRLSGRAVRVGPEEQHKNFADALGDLQPGDTVYLGKGEYRLFFPGPLGDIAIIGRGAEKTLVTMRLSQAERIRIEGVKIRCRDNECVDLRRGGTLQLKNCHVFEYNSGAGGSNAISASNAVILVEGCSFEGNSGRASGRSGGDAFDLRGDNFLYVRNSKFIDNSEIVRASFPAVFDRCSSQNAGDWDHGIMPYGPGKVFLRDNKTKVSIPGATREFRHATDDREFIDFVLSKTDEIDALSRELARVIAARRNLPYWIGLLRHGDREVRTAAAKQIERLTDQTVILEEESVKKADPAEIGGWIRDLDHDDFETREKATKKLMGAGEGARKKLEEILRSGSMEQKLRARRILSTLQERIPLPHEVEYGRLIRWFEANRDGLEWDESAGKYVDKE